MVEEKIVPKGTICHKCRKNINLGILQSGTSAGFMFFCKECHLKTNNKKEN